MQVQYTKLNLFFVKSKTNLFVTKENTLRVLLETEQPESNLKTKYVPASKKQLKVTLLESLIPGLYNFEISSMKIEKSRKSLTLCIGYCARAPS